MSALIQQPTVAVTSPDGSFDGPDDVWMPENPVGLASIRTNNNRKTNFRFNTYLDQVRIEKATELLDQTDMKIYEIAASVGYKNVV